MSIAQQLITIYNTKVHKKFNVALNLMWITVGKFIRLSDKDLPNRDVQPHIDSKH